MRLNITTTIRVALFVDERGIIGKSEIKTDYANNYDYVVGADGQTWLFNQVHIIGYYEKTQTEEIEIDLEEIDLDF